MGTVGGDDFGFGEKNENLLDYWNPASCPNLHCDKFMKSSTTSSVSLCKPAPFMDGACSSGSMSCSSLTTGCDLHALEREEMGFEGSMLSPHQGTFPSQDSRFSEIASPFDPFLDTSIVQATSPTEQPSKDHHRNVGNSGVSIGRLDGKKRKRTAENPPIESSSQFNSVQTIKEDEKRDVKSSKGDDEMKSKIVQKPGANTAKPSSKQGMEQPQNGDAPKEGYIHVRARRGQATNSHSLAERVRRERISERMKFLQDLVPGCSKVTGKALMLDEIINYVQSLQKQVEFLSMKLATVNPQMDSNIERILSEDLLSMKLAMNNLQVESDIQRILSKDILNSQGGVPLLLDFSPGHCLSDPFVNSSRQGTSHAGTAARSIENTIPGVWDDDLHSIVQMGFGTEVPFDIEPNSKITR
ncbi:hypothetical protein AMTRI_Chr12g238730 [Amborella trichopoda]|uniref:BHLH domain-containing protein n=1 Tax=Amborella trichopoda TaxID=13333 RepID=U5DAU6_AMBTC|nr:transcription factor bHLH62 [Amborella trichopoda]ERN18532.1 hypothetical protein AMTR_s00065p00068810 [Amborella trichopoda]|eukprot:XP_020530937.1 transcription factor bHLH62 [Amborella trichopoda]